MLPTWISLPQKLSFTCCSSQIFGSTVYEEEFHCYFKRSESEVLIIQQTAHIREKIIQLSAALRIILSCLKLHEIHGDNRQTNSSCSKSNGNIRRFSTWHKPLILLDFCIHSTHLNHKRKWQYAWQTEIQVIFIKTGFSHYEKTKQNKTQRLHIKTGKQWQTVSGD